MRSWAGRRNAAKAAVAAVVLALTLSCIALPGTGAARPRRGASIYWGGWIGNQLTGTAAPWDMSAVTKFEQMTGKPLSLVEFGSPFADCSSNPCSFYPFPTTPMGDIR